MLVFSTRLPLKAEITHEDCMRLFTEWVKGSPHYQTDGLYFDVDSHDDYDYTKRYVHWGIEDAEQDREAMNIGLKRNKIVSKK